MIGYFRYVDGILTIYYQRKTKVEETITEFNEQQDNITFTIQKEMHNSVNFLDLTIYRTKTKLEFAVYRKHTRKRPS
jgi:DNA-directed RNA polymerase subunit L